MNLAIDKTSYFFTKSSIRGWHETEPNHINTAPNTTEAVEEN